LCVVVGLFAAAALSVVAIAQSTTTHNVTLAVADQSVDASGRTVITMMASGDLNGVLTVALQVRADGSIATGEWALNVSYTAPLNPNAQPDPSLPDPDSPLEEQFIQRGVLKGTLTGGSETLANGQVVAISGLQLSLTGGTVEYASVTSGNGTLQGSNLSDRDNSNGSMTLKF
jgi:hypothetical protein